MNKKIMTNIIANVVSFLTSTAISFFMVPYIVSSLGESAYGFVSLGDNFVNYIRLITIALNSMAGRFITIEIHRDNKEDANKYFSSLVMANVVMSVVMLIPIVLLIVFVDKIINVPVEMVWDVKVLWSLLFANFIASMMSSIFTVSTFVENRLDLTSKREIEAVLIKAAILLIAFRFFKPQLWYVGVAWFAYTLYIALRHIIYTKEFLPFLKVSKKYFSIAAIKELLSSGIWNSINRVGQLLLEGVDLLIANLLIGPGAMGVLALAKLIPETITTLVGVISNAFAPDFTIHFAKNDTDGLVASIKNSIKIASICVNIPMTVLIIFGKDFFTLWQPTQNAMELQALSVITCIGLVFTGGMNCIFSVLTVINKVKVNSIALIILGVLNTVIVLILLKTTNLGLYAVAGVSMVMVTLKNMFYLLPYVARALKLKWTAFYPVMMKSVAVFIVLLAVSFGLHSLLATTTWLSLVLVGVLTAVICLVINVLVIFKPSEIRAIAASIRKEK